MIIDNKYKNGTVPQIILCASKIAKYHPEIGRNYGETIPNCMHYAKQIKKFDEKSRFKEYGVDFLRQAVAAYFRGWEGYEGIEDFEGRFDDYETKKSKALSLSKNLKLEERVS